VVEEGTRFEVHGKLRFERFNHYHIARLLAASNSNVSQAARQCGLERQALKQMMRRYGIKADLFR